MNYTQLEDDIVTRLAPIATAGHEVIAIPSSQAQNNLLGRKSRITVQAGISKFDEENIRSTSMTTVQDEWCYIEIIIQSKLLREVGGTYTLAELARRLLIGWTPPGCSRPIVGVDFSGVSPDELRDSIFTYSLRVKTQMVSVGTADPDIDNLIQQITFIDGGTYGPLMPTALLISSAYSVNSPGDSVMLAWITENGYSVSIDNGIGDVEPVGSLTVSVTSDVTYTITVTRGVEVATASVDLTVGVVCAPVQVELNGTQLAEVPSGDTYNIEVINSNLDPVGDDSNPNNIGDSLITSSAGNYNDSVAAEDTYVIPDVVWTQPDGSQQSSEYGQPIVCTPPTPCADATVENSDQSYQQSVASGATLVVPNTRIEVNGSLLVNQPSTIAKNVVVKYVNGTPVGSIVGGEVEVPNPTPVPSVAVGVSNATPNFGDSITITATPTNITPNSYIFFALDASNNIRFIAEQAGNSKAWTVTLSGALRVFVGATNDNVNWYFGKANVTSATDADANAFLAAIANTSDTIAIAIQQLVMSMKSNSIWTKYHAIYPFVGGTAAAHKFNLKNPADSDAAYRLTFFGGVTHSATGFTPNGTNGYAETYLNDNTVMTLNSAHISVYSRTNVDGLFADMGVISGSANTNILSKFGNIFYPRLQAENSGIANSTSSLGLFVSNRVGSTEVRAFQNGVLKQITSANVGKANATHHIGRANGGGLFYSPRQYAFGTIGTGLTDTDGANMYTIVQQFQTTLSRQV